MRKSLLTLLVTVSLLAGTEAMASRARLLVFGTGDGGMLLGTTGNNGSFYVEDAYNSFYNPSYINDYNDWVTVEKAGGPGNRAQGGFSASVMNFNLGVFMNRFQSYGGLYATNDQDFRPLDFIIGSDMGVKWGLRAQYGSHRTKGTTVTPNRFDRDLTLNFGAQIRDFHPFISWKAMGMDESGTDKVKNKDIGFGLRYKYGEWTPYAAWRSVKSEVGTTETAKMTAYGLGVGRNMKIADATTLHYAISFWKSSASGTYAATNDKHNMIPLDVGVESDALSWLTVRAGVMYALWDRKQGNTQTDTTTGRVGATFHVGQADLDWVVGSGTTTATEAPASADTNTFDFSNGLFTAASLTYRW